MRETKITGFERNKRKAWSLGRKRKDKERDGTKIWRRFLQAEEQAARFEFRRWDTGAGTRLAEQFGGGRGVPKWPEAPGVCKFRLIEKNDEVPGVPPRVHFQPLFLFRCVLPEWPRALRQTSYLPIYLPTPPSIYEVRDGAALSLSYPSILTIATNAVPLSYHCHSPHRPLSARCFLFSSLSLSLSLSLSPFPIFHPSLVPFPTGSLHSCIWTIAAHFDPCISVCLVPPDLHTFFRGQLSVIRRSTWIDGGRGGGREEWHNSARERATSGINGAREERREGARGSVPAVDAQRARGRLRGWFRGPGNAFNKDR